MRPNASQPAQDIELKIVGSNVFGRTPKISPQQTFNMFISDDWLVQTPGYKKTIDYIGAIRGRAIYSSDRGNFMIAVLDNNVYRISGPSNLLTSQFIFSLDTFLGDVFIDENNASQIAICDGLDVWIYNFATGTVNKAVIPINDVTSLPISPGYVTFHDGYFIVPDKNTSNWYLSAQNNGLDWNWGAGDTAVFGSIQTKPDNAVAVLRAPGKGNLVLVFGRDVTEMWYDNGQQGFPYQRSNSTSVDYGCLSPNTIAAMDNYIAWLGVNEKSGPVIMVSTGAGFNRLSTDGIDFKLADIQYPQESYAFFYKSDGHVFYQITFFNGADNFTLLYDFNSQKFFYLTDEFMNFHIAEAVAFFNNTYYFVSIDNPSIYELNSKYFTYDYTTPSRINPNPNVLNEKEIPRMRICNNVRQMDTSPFVGNSLTFTIEQGVDEVYKGSDLYFLIGEDGDAITGESPFGYVGTYIGGEKVVNDYVPRVDLAISKDGGQTFGNFIQKQLNPLGKRRNRLIFYRFGYVNDLVCQFRFWSKSSVTVSDGLLQSRMMQGN